MSHDPTDRSSAKREYTAEEVANEANLQKSVDAERRVGNEIDPGARALVVAIGVLILLGSFALPHTGSANAWDVLAMDRDAVAEEIALPSRIFVWITLVFSIGFSVLALVTRRWALSWVALYGSGVGTVFGLLATWSRQTLPSTSPGAGPGIGLILAWIVVAILTFHWLKVVWTRSSQQWAAAERRREATAAAASTMRRGPDALQ